MSQIRDISAWFNNQIWTPRLVYAVGFQSLTTLSTTLATIILLQLNIFHPISSLFATISVPLSWRCWLISFVTGIIVIPSSVTVAHILTAKDQSFRTQFLQSGWRFLVYVLLWTTLHLFADLGIALCCLRFGIVDKNSSGVVFYGVVATGLYSVTNYFLNRRYRLEFPADLDYSSYKRRIAYVYENSVCSRTRQIAQFVGQTIAIVIVTFLLFGWRFNRFFFKYPTTFVDAMWHVIICQPSVVWSITVLSTAAIIRQNATKVLFDLFLCQARLVKLLIDDGVDVNGADRFGKTALMHAATLGARAAVQAILNDDRVEASGADHFGNTSLILACSAGHETVALLLLQHLKKRKSLENVLSYVDVQNSNGDSALTLALKNGHVDCANLLSEYVKPFQFVLPSSDPLPIGSETELLVTLGEALSIDRFPLMKYLAFLDLRRLTRQRQPRMQQIFTVSSPGGHPRCWLSIVTPMLQSLQHQIEMFRDINDRLAAAWEFKIDQATAGRGLAIGGSRIPSLIQPKHWNRDWKLQSSTSYTPVKENGNKQPTTTALASKGFLPAFVKGFWVINRSLVGHETLWVDLEMQLWNIEAFGHIIASSYTDDKYGVVQRDLATIIGNLLDLYSASDRYARLATSQRIDRNQKLDMDSRLTLLRDRLTETVDEINAVFGNLNDIRLTDQQRHLLQRLTESGAAQK